MPFQSKAQARFLYAKHPTLAKEFSSKTRSIKSLPEYAGGKKGTKKRMPLLEKLEGMTGTTL